MIQMRKTAELKGLEDAVKKQGVIPLSPVLLSPMAGGPLLTVPYTEALLYLSSYGEKDKKILKQLLNDKELKKLKLLKDLQVKRDSKLEGNSFFEYAYDEDNPKAKPKVKVRFGKDVYGPQASMAEDPGTVAHELGHAMDFAENGDFYSTPGAIASEISSYGLVPTSTAVAMGGDASPGALALAGLAGSALNYSQLRAEIVASQKGYDLLRRAGKGRLEALGAYSGVPSYVLNTVGTNMAPAATLGLLQHFTGA